MLVTGAYPAATAEGIAELLNITPRWVRQLAKEGVIPRPERGKYDVAGAVKGYVKYLQARAEGRGVEGQDVHAERARLVRARAHRAEMEAATMERSLLPFDEVVRAWQQLVAAFRAKCLALPSKLAPRLAMSESRQIQAELTAAVREALEELSRFDLPRDRPGRPRGEAGANGKSRPRRAPVH
jgi:phage terminase Nu1 subunit (DNA packaging protein)